MWCSQRSNSFIHRIKNTHLALFGTALNLYLQESIRCPWWIMQPPKTHILHWTRRSDEAVCGSRHSPERQQRWEPGGSQTSSHRSPVPTQDHRNNPHYLPQLNHPLPPLDTRIIDVLQTRERNTGGHREKFRLWEMTGQNVQALVRRRAITPYTWCRDAQSTETQVSETGGTNQSDKRLGEGTDGGK